MLQLLFHTLTTKLSTQPFKKFLNTRVHRVEELLDIWHGLQHSAADSAVDRECIFSPAYGPKEDSLHSDYMLIK